MKTIKKYTARLILFIIGLIKFPFQTVWFLIGIIGYLLHESASYTAITKKTWDKVYLEQTKIRLNRKYEKAVLKGNTKRAARLFIMMEKIK